MDSALVVVLANAGVAGVFAALFCVGLVYPRSVVTDLKEENRDLKAALKSERNRAEAAVTAAAATRDILAAIQLGQHLQLPGHER